MKEILEALSSSSDRKFTVLLATIVFCCKAKKPSTSEVLNFIEKIQKN